MDDTRTIMDDAFRDMVTDFSSDDVHWDGGKRLLAWWLEHAEAKGLPSRSDFSPAYMRHYLPTLIMHDVDKRQIRPDYRIRLCGMGFRDYMGFDPTGKPLDDIPGTAMMRLRYDWLCRNRKPYMCVRLPLDWGQNQRICYSTLVLPLGEDDRVTIIMASVYFHHCIDGQC
ncbi:PAS domain-containing protein [Eilatimonas milleporae]|nr:PAS domain-containing protein [Eilatimonas milleporae]